MILRVRQDRTNLTLWHALDRQAVRRRRIGRPHTCRRPNPPDVMAVKERQSTEIAEREGSL